jgi:asparagine synthase (glutamine-hydrolysing)
MCGIAGFAWLNGRAASVEHLTPMTNAIAHRGPDGEGAHVEKSVALGHRRLAIIDLSEAANQPMDSQSGRWTIVYNGEIYNFKDVRAELHGLGWSFNTDGDTEVILAAMDQWGEAGLEKLNGMFAFVALDRKENRLLIARDRFGVKPLYYGFFGGAFLFGSEIKALVAHPAFQAKLNVTGMAEYLSFMNFISDETLFDGVHLLPAGTIASLPLAGANAGKLSMRQFWDYRFTGVGTDYDEAELIDEIEAAFSVAVERQMISDVGVSSYLSGGVDSGSITAIAAGKTNLLRTFTCGFDISNAGDDAIFDERAAARLMSQTFETQHYEHILGPQDFRDHLVPLIRQMEEPRVGQSYPNFVVSELAKSQETVVLSGAGGDELFGGYAWRYFNGLPARNFDQYIDGYLAHWRRLVPTDAKLKQYLAPVWDQAREFDARETFLSIYPEEARSASTVDEYLNWSLYFEAKTFLNGLLVVEDKVAMAHSLETRVPFLDNDFVDLACRIPIRAKLKDVDGAIARQLELRANPNAKPERRDDGKAILRKMMARLVPEEISSRKKQGFSAPDESWFRNELHDFVHTRLLSGSSRIYDVIDRKAVEGMLADHDAGANQRTQIWAMLSLQETLDHYGL